MSSPEHLIATAVLRVNSAHRSCRPVATFGMFSGGHDSLTAAYITSLSDGFTAQCHIDTGIGIRETREFVRETCTRQQWPLLVYRAAENVRADGTPDPQIYADMVMAHGFPGPAHHYKMYQRLKERQVERLVRDHKRRYSREVVLLVSGRRTQESARRSRTVVEFERDGNRWWVNPIYDFSKDDCHAVMNYARLERNLVVDLIHKSGECLCGAFAAPGELAELAFWFPDTANEIKALEAKVRSVHGWGWEERPPKKCERSRGSLKPQPLCDSCLLNGTSLGLK